VTTPEHHILCLNSGSSSLKFAVYALGGGEERRRLEGAVERIGLDGARLWLRDGRGAPLEDGPGDFGDHRAALAALPAALERGGSPALDAVGHRVVHGGPDHTAPVRVDAALIAELRTLSRFAPLHVPSAIEAVEAVSQRYPELPQVACFDTAFHRRMPEVAQRLPLPRALWDEGLRRYGFHGLSYEYVLAELGDEPPGRAIIAHLGNGASLAAVRDGRPVDTTMGFTPTGGLVMGTRSGDLDPGVLLYLLREKAYDVERLERLVDREAGLLGVSGSTSDMKALLEMRETDTRAAQAVEMFCYAVRKHIGALAAVLGGLDVLVFTGGIGERAPAVRDEICRGLEHLGTDVRVIPTNEDLMIARHTRKTVLAP
jgi:acetate kinase